ncbi:MAG TPA: hypothetical protein VK881_14470 [bacterium]|nr:hypothetical protein [bacterium]
MRCRAINILGPEIGCAILACLLLVTSPTAGGPRGQPLRAQRVSGRPAVLSGQLAQTAPGGLLQGQVPLADQQSGRSLTPYALNVGLVGHNSVLNRGLNGNLAWVDDCAYVSAFYGGTHPYAGLAVVSVTDPANPRLVQIFPGTPGTREGQVEGSQTSRMLVVMTFSDYTAFGDLPGPNLLEFYQAPVGDCSHPVRVGTYDFGPIVPHEFRIWGDKIFVTNFGGFPGPSLMVIDAHDMANPQLLTTWDLSDEPGMPTSIAHDLDILGADDALAGDGSRAYVNVQLSQPIAWPPTRNGLVILDTSEVVQAKPNPVLRRVGPVLTWSLECCLSHSAAIVSIAGRRYILAMDETFRTDFCPWGSARIIDVQDETQPVQVSTFSLQVQDPANCPQALGDNAIYSAHYLGVDDPNNAKLAFFTWYSSGLRVVDISNPAAPREVGYFNPGASPNTLFFDTSLTHMFNRNVDYAISYVRFYQGNIWFTSVYGGFWVVQYQPPTTLGTGIPVTNGSPPATVTIPATGVPPATGAAP